MPKRQRADFGKFSEYKGPPVSLRTALAFAKRKHSSPEEQGSSGRIRRKVKIFGRNGLAPQFFTHPVGVAKIIRDWIKRYPKRMSYKERKVIFKTAVLHDVLEDTKTSAKDIEELFGKEVRKKVEELTHNRQERKRLGKIKYYSNEMMKMSREALIVKLADLCHNLATLSSEEANSKIFLTNAEEILKNIKPRIAKEDDFVKMGYEDALKEVQRAKVFLEAEKTFQRWIKYKQPERAKVFLINLISRTEDSELRKRYKQLYKYYFGETLKEAGYKKASNRKENKERGSFLAVKAENILKEGAIQMGLSDAKIKEFLRNRKRIPLKELLDFMVERYSEKNWYKLKARLKTINKRIEGINPLIFPALNFIATYESMLSRKRKEDVLKNLAKILRKEGENKIADILEKENLKDYLSSFITFYPTTEAMGTTIDFD